VELGSISKPNPQAKSYNPGQFFIHRLLGYRGVVVDQWNPSVHTYPSLTSDSFLGQRLTANSHIRDVGAAAVNRHPFYQVFCDSRDVNEDASRGMGVQHWTHTSGFAGGVDYVDHHDIIPFTPSNPSDFRNGLHSLYFRRHSPWNTDLNGSTKVNVKSILTSDYSAWEKLSHQANRYSKVYRTKTSDIQVTVIPFFEHRADQTLSTRIGNQSHPYVWLYKILIENQGNSTLQLVSRTWNIRDQNNHVESVAGSGVVGTLPVLSRNTPAFQYISSVTLAAPSGQMGGSFAFVEILPNNTAGLNVECEIPTFELRSPFESVQQDQEEDFRPHANVHRIRKDDE